MSDRQRDAVLERPHVVEGFLRALDDPLVLLVIDEASDRAAARLRLSSPEVGLSEVQANHVLDMPLGRRTQLGRAALREELDDPRRQLA